jgi:hypothetical protein
LARGRGHTNLISEEPVNIMLFRRSVDPLGTILIVFLSVRIVGRVYVQNGVKRIYPLHYLSKTLVSHVPSCKSICS